jgi:hypothetical protein
MSVVHSYPVSMALLVSLVCPSHAMPTLILEFTPGCAVITLDKALMFTDGRYFLQAEKQLDSLVLHV